ncbi:hypothetical protein C8J57DRAFT_1705090 [Mycena rebaudengoi]|nr:hypothetical protein C8J57DRAFT_1705090 [Mycena rebaudengoi]
MSLLVREWTPLPRAWSRHAGGLRTRTAIESRRWNSFERPSLDLWIDGCIMRLETDDCGQRTGIGEIPRYPTQDLLSAFPRGLFLSLVAQVPAFGILIEPRTTIGAWIEDGFGDRRLRPAPYN